MICYPEWHSTAAEIWSRQTRQVIGVRPDASTVVVEAVAVFGNVVATIETQTRELQSAAHALGQPIQIFTAGSERELDAAFESMRQLRVGALLVGADVFFASRRTQIVTLAARHSVPAVYEQRAFAEAGGLMSYGTNIAEGYRQAGRYTGRILKGEKPADLPVVQLSKFELIINLKTAKVQGLTIPPGVLAIADEVIE
jgi:putative tryptophan/tyrosine transport system substrate-binding protein